MTRSLYFTEYHPNVPKNCGNRHFDVGPFTVHVSNKGHYRLYTSEVGGVLFLKQASYPSIDQLVDDLRKAVTLGRIPSSVAKTYLESSLPLLNKHPAVGGRGKNKVKNTVLLDAMTQAELKAKRRK